MHVNSHLEERKSVFLELLSRLSTLRNIYENNIEILFDVNAIYQHVKLTLEYFAMNNIVTHSNPDTKVISDNTVVTVMIMNEVAIIRRQEEIHRVLIHRRKSCLELFDVFTVFSAFFPINFCL